MNEPLISVLISCYNHEKYVQETLRSVLAQTYHNLELILFNDGSKDASHAKILELQSECESRFVRFIYTNKSNEGLARTLNRGLELAGGEFVFHIASDDFVEPHAIERLAEVAIPSPEIGVACGDADFVDASGTRIFLDTEDRVQAVPNSSTATTFVEYYTRRRDDFDYKRDFGKYWTLLRGNYLPIGLLVRRCAHVEAGPYDASCCTEDYDMWLRISKRYKIHFVPDVLAHYRWHSSNTSKTLRPQLIRDAIGLLLREKVYCLHNNHVATWESAYRSLFGGYFLWLLRRGDYSLAARLAQAGNLSLVIQGMASAARGALRGSLSRA